MAAINPESIFPELDLPELKDQATLWAKRYPAIEKISLYKGREGQRYNLVVEAETPPEVLEDLKKAKATREKNPTKDVKLPPWPPEYREYINAWSDPTGLHIHKDLIRVYRGDSNHQAYLDEWFIYNKTPAEPIPDDLKITDSGILLYEKMEGGLPGPLNQNKGQNIKQDVIATNKEVEDVENWVRRLRIGIEDDSTLTIQLPKKPAITATNTTIGFNRTDTKGWQELIGVLGDSSHYYWVSNESQRKRLYRTGDKLIKYLSNEFSWEFPRNYNIYELVKSEPPGTYRFKFRVVGGKPSQSLNEKIAKMGKDETLKRWNELVRSKSKLQGDRYDEFILLSRHVLDKKFLTEEEIKDMIRGKSAYEDEHKATLQALSSDGLVKYDMNQMNRVRDDETP